MNRRGFVLFSGKCCLSSSCILVQHLSFELGGASVTIAVNPPRVYFLWQGVVTKLNQDVKDSPRLVTLLRKIHICALPLFLLLLIFGVGRAKEKKIS